jgi:hypothetical protein
MGSKKPKPLKVVNVKNAQNLIHSSPRILSTPFPPFYFFIDIPYSCSMPSYFLYSPQTSKRSFPETNSFLLARPSFFLEMKLQVSLLHYANNSHYETLVKTLKKKTINHIFFLHCVSSKQTNLEHEQGNKPKPNITNLHHETASPINKQNHHI